MQYEITSSLPLLDEHGDLTRAGYAKHLLPVYDRSRVRGGAARLKEWDYYYVGNDRCGLALTIADNSYMGLDSVSFLVFEGEPWQITKSPMRIFPMGKTGLPSTSAAGDVGITGKGYSILFRHTVDASGAPARQLIFHMDAFREKEAIDGAVLLTEEPDESMVICTPFDKPGHFYYNQKINCMRASGSVTIGGETWQFDPADSFGVLDWGRGVWTYHNTWYWGSASGALDGVPFGFNIGYGFGNTAAASENMLFYAGKAHKLSQVTFHIPQKDGKDDFMSPWTFTSDDGRFEMHFLPVLDRAACTDFKVLKSDQHQVFGRFTGTAVLDDGTVLSVRDFMGFAEKVENKW